MLNDTKQCNFQTTYCSNLSTTFRGWAMLLYRAGFFLGGTEAISGGDNFYSGAGCRTLHPCKYFHFLRCFQVCVLFRELYHHPECRMKKPCIQTMCFLNKTMSTCLNRYNTSGRVTQGHNCALLLHKNTINVLLNL